MAAFHAKPETGRTGRDPKDRYETPDDVVDALVEGYGLELSCMDAVVDPCCGTGRIIRRLEHHGLPPASGTDIEEHGVDFLAPYGGHMPRGMVACVTNPPYSHAREFVEQALRTFPGPVAMLMPQDFLSSAGRRDWLMGEGRPAGVLGIPWRIKFFRRDGTLISGQAYSHSWVVWPQAILRPAAHTAWNLAELSPERAQRVAVGSGQYNRAGKQMWGGLNARKAAGDDTPAP